MTSLPRTIADLPTPALVFDVDALDRNLATMTAERPASQLRPHVKAHKCTALAARQHTFGHDRFTCATPREMIGMAAAGVGSDLLLANEVLDPGRLQAMAALQDDVRITVAIDSVDTLDAASRAGIANVVVDINVGLPRCGCPPADAARLADLARTRGMAVRGVMAYEGHLMVMDDDADKRQRAADAIATLREVHDLIGGELVTTGGTGTFHLHPHDHGDAVWEVQAGSYALMDSHYARNGHPFEQACWIVGTVISANDRWAVADVGLKALGMDHGNPTMAPIDGEAPQVWFCSDEHVTFDNGARLRPGHRVLVVPAHIDPTMAMHPVAWVVRGDDVVDRWPIDLRHW